MIIIFEKDVSSIAMNIIEKAYNNTIYEEPIDDEVKENVDKIYENIENIKTIINENRKYLEDEKDKFDKLMDEDNISSDNYMVFILTVNTFNEFVNDLEKYIHICQKRKHIGDFTRKLMNNIKIYLSELSSLSNKNEIKKRHASFGNNNYISIEPVIGKLSRFAARIQEEIYKMDCNIYDEEHANKLVLKPDDKKDKK